MMLMLKLGAILAIMAGAPIAGSSSDAPTTDAELAKVRVIMGPPCGAACTCVPSFLPGLNIADSCLSIQSQNSTLNIDGCCDETWDPACAQNTFKGCLMGGTEYRLQMLGAPCTCTELSISTGGAEIPDDQDSIPLGQWSTWIVIGGFGMLCDADASGSLIATCTSGGTPTPRTVVDIDFSYVCSQCGG